MTVWSSTKTGLLDNKSIHRVGAFISAAGYGAALIVLWDITYPGAGGAR